MYNKLFSKIVTSSIWLEPTPTRIVWVMFIAMMNEDGFVQFASAANVAHTARIKQSEAEQALKILESPDKNSADEDYEGRRIERVPGGWIVLNAEKYRKLATREMVREQTRIRVARKRQKDKSVTQGNAPVTHSNEKLTPSVSVSDTKKEEGANGSRSTASFSVEDWLKELEAEDCYKGINVRAEYGKCRQWCLIHGRTLSKRRFINWINRAEKPLTGSGIAKPTYKRNYPPPPREPTQQEIENARAIAREEMERFRKRLTPNKSDA